MLEIAETLCRRLHDIFNTRFYLAGIVIKHKIKHQVLVGCIESLQRVFVEHFGYGNKRKGQNKQNKRTKTTGKWSLQNKIEWMKINKTRLVIKEENKTSTYSLKSYREKCTTFRIVQMYLGELPSSKTNTEQKHYKQIT